MTNPQLASDAYCACGHVKQSVECWNCGGEGVFDHDCGEDCCACLYPEDNVPCDICRGEGSYPVCISCHPEVGDDH